MRAGWLIAVTCGLALASCGTTGGSSDSTTTSSTTSTGSTTSNPSTTSTTSSTSSSEPAALTLTPQGLGPLQLGMSLEDAQATGLVGTFEPGCEIVSPRPQVAPLQPVQGSVEVNGGSVTSITVSGGDVVTAPGGVAPGDPLAEAVAAWEAAGLEVSVDESTEEMFGVWFVDVLDDGELAFGSSADPADETVGPITVPELIACE